MSAEPLPPFIEDLIDRSAAFTAGYDLGLLHGRAAERATIEQDRARGAAAEQAVRISESPVVDLPALRRGRAAARILLGGEE